MPNQLFALSSMLLAFAAPGSSPDWDAAVSLFRQQAQQQKATIHVPRVTMTTSTTFILRSSRPPEMKEKKTDDCIGIEKLAGFVVTQNDSVDLVLTDRSVLRAKLGDECPALGFYAGFYVKAVGDRKICAKRDSFRSRSGKSCAIQAFRKLVPVR